MNKILISPSKYVQGAGAISELAQLVAVYGKKAAIFGGKTALSTVQEVIESTFNKANIEFVIKLFNGECSANEVNRIRILAENEKADMIIGIGGGKVLDAVKAAAYYTKLPVIIVPTIAATDAPCSALSVIYTDDGIFESYLMLPKNPDLVLLDTNIIAHAPLRLLVSGMGDALATWFEADACSKSFANNMSGGKSTKAALAIARLCYDTLLEYGYLATLAVKQNVVTEAVEQIVEANTLLSGLGFESSGLAAAHAIHNGLTALPETHDFYHGEKVAIGTLAQLVLENRDRSEIEEALNFCCEVGLPITLSDIGIKEISYEKIMKVANLACASGETIHNMPFTVEPEAVAAALLTVDALGNDIQCSGARHSH